VVVGGCIPSQVKGRIRLGKAPSYWGACCDNNAHIYIQLVRDYYYRVDKCKPSLVKGYFWYFSSSRRNFCRVVGVGAPTTAKDRWSSEDSWSKGEIWRVKYTRSYSTLSCAFWRVKRCSIHEEYEASCVQCVCTVVVCVWTRDLRTKDFVNQTAVFTLVSYSPITLLLLWWICSLSRHNER